MNWNRRDGEPGARAYEAFVKCFEAGVLGRDIGDILAFSPPLIIEDNQQADFQHNSQGARNGEITRFHPPLDVTDVRGTQTDLQA
ncbi:MAG: Omega-amino acid--pyruvate aminotransferase (EC [uncultured Caballeronia sp.]|nr:MAG: Omega-amino acid--pyruvate aminotransferase (EC [uncultured Caballeronia sp.]